MKALLLRCPKCKQTMKYQSRDRILTFKVKRCVYCGRSFKVLANIIR